MTFREVYKKGISELLSHGIKEAGTDAWYLLEFVTGMSRALYFAISDHEIDAEKSEEYFRLIEKRNRRIPLQYITGVQEFMGLEFQVNEHVLIPRQDTEILVEECLSFLNQWEKPLRILDMCTGSGCILLSLLKHTKYPERVSSLGTDISEDALRIAEENARNLHIKTEFRKSDLFEKIEGKFDMIVSNPPYIPTRDIEELEEEVKNYEPKGALDGKEDGLYFYRKLIKESPAYLSECGRLFFEIGYNQGEQVSSLMKEAGFSEVTVKKDLAGLDRIVFGMYDKKR